MGFHRSPDADKAEDLLLCGLRHILDEVHAADPSACEMDVMHECKTVTRPASSGHTLGLRFIVANSRVGIASGLMRTKGRIYYGERREQCVETSQGHEGLARLLKKSCPQLRGPMLGGMA